MACGGGIFSRRSVAKLAPALVACTLGAGVLAAVPGAPAGASDASSPGRARHFVTQYDAGGHLRVVRWRGEPGAYRAADKGTTVVSSEPETVVRALGATDPMRPAQWALNRASFEAAWGVGKGYGVKVAVVDTGVRGDHEDLAPNMLQGKDFVQSGGNGWNDQNGHGTHVAGIIAAAANNGRGIAGGAPGVKILPVRVLDANGSGYSSNVAAGVIWAADQGARVINLSLGGTLPSSGTREAIKYANKKGAIVLAAAGNGAETGNQAIYPAAFPEAVAVGAVDTNLNRASFSNHGWYLDIAAPGVGIRSTFNGSTTSYADMSGTSMATPYASATAALVASINKQASANGIRNFLQHSATDLGPAGADTQYGSGLINPYAAALRAVPKPAGWGTKGNGYWVVSADGAVRAYGKARFAGDMRGRWLPAPVVASAATRTGKGYWLAGADGSVYAFGDAKYYGSMGGRRLNAKIVGMSVTPSGKGYLLLGADGGIFTFGDAKFRGSTGAMRLAAPVLDMTMTRSGNGYWMVAADGGVFTFGDARFRGSTGNLRLASPVVSMTGGSKGYWLVARDGGIFAFGVPFVGSLPGLGAQHLPPGARIRALDDGKGYYILGVDGAVFNFGTAKFFGAAAPLSPWVPAIDLMLAPH
jgi:type VII secretion-associated serine protease mycosin